jgi:CheY-like chemotaxis protein
MELLAYGCRTFLLDIHMGGERKVEGLETLEQIKQECPDAFCAVVTGDQRYRGQALSLRADWYCGKDDSEIEQLIERLNEVYLRRRLDLTDEVTVRRVGSRLREPPAVAGNPADCLLQQAFERFDFCRKYVDARIADGDFMSAAQELVLLEPIMRALARLSPHCGEGFGIVIHALWNAAVQQPGRELTPDHWNVWQNVLSSVLDRTGLTVPEACRLAEELDEAGFITEPPHWGGIAEILDGLTDDTRLP